MTDRYSIHVDAGYLVAQGGSQLYDETNRPRLHVDYASLVELVTTQVTHYVSTPSSLLRLYWYDAVLDDVPLSYREEIAYLPRLKMRMGRLARDRTGRTRQKGVDTRIVLDLVRLAYDRAVTTAFLVGGDEDLVEGVKTAQDAGLSVVVLTPPRRGGLSTALAAEADEIVEIAAENLQQVITRRSFQGLETAAVIVDDEGLEERVDAEAQRFVDMWMAEVGEETARGVVDHINVESRAGRHMNLPRDVAGWLLKASDENLNGLLTQHPELRNYLRSAFILALGERLARSR